jgi:hypothetical protein
VKTLLATAALLSISAGAFAQTPATPAPAQAPAQTTAQTSAQTSAQSSAQASTRAPSAAATAPLRQQIVTDLQKAGFTEVTVKPDSFLVTAKDKAGNPVTMFISPDAVEEIVGARGTVGTPPTTAMASGPGMFSVVPTSDHLSSKIVGLTVRNGSNQEVGEIKDIALNPAGAVQAYIVSVGGFLGMGDHNVAVKPSAISITWNAGEKAWHARMNATAEQLKAAPEFKYPAKS